MSQVLTAKPKLGVVVLQTPYNEVEMKAVDEYGCLPIKTRLKTAIVYDGGNLFPAAIDQAGKPYTPSAEYAADVELSPMTALLLIYALDAKHKYTLTGAFSDEITDFDHEVAKIRERTTNGSVRQLPSRYWTDICLDNYGTNADLSLACVIDEFSREGRIGAKERRWLLDVGLLFSDER